MSTTTKSSDIRQEYELVIRVPNNPEETQEIKCLNDKEAEGMALTMASRYPLNTTVDIYGYVEGRRIYLNTAEHIVRLLAI